jgi:hypothetical protein
MIEMMCAAYTHVFEYCMELVVVVNLPKALEGMADPPKT